MGNWNNRLAIGHHWPGLGVGAWIFGRPNGLWTLGKIVAWNWQDQKLHFTVDYWVGRWGKTQGNWGVYDEGRDESNAKNHGVWPAPHTERW